MRAALGPLVLAACALAPPPPAAADAVSFPYQREAKTDLWLLAGGGGVALLAGLAAVHQESLDSLGLAALDPGGLPPLDRGAVHNWSPSAGTASDVLVWSSVAAPALYAGLGHDGEERGTLLALYAETLLLTNATVQLLKGTTDRVRPYAYNDDPRIPPDARTSRSAVRSFPSSHAANGFAAAVFLGTAYGKIHPDSPARGWVWAGGLAVATATGVLRVASGSHFPTDLLAGALVGSATAWLVLELHEGGSPSGSSPSFGLSAGAPGLAWTVRF